MGNEHKGNQIPDLERLRTEIEELKTRLAPDKLAYLIGLTFLLVIFDSI